MRDKVWEQAEGLVNDYIQPNDLLTLVHSYLRDKQQESCYWQQLTLYSHWMAGGSSDSIYRLAAISELFMLALDIVDDLQDQDNVDKPWMVSPPSHTLNAVLGLLNCCYGELGRLKESEPFAIYPLLGEASRLAALSIEGQYRDISNAVESEEDYIIMVQQKSGSLIRLAMYFGLAVSPMSSPQLAVLDELASCLGIIAQLENDLRDVGRLDAKSDLLSRKKTLPVLYLLSYSEEDFPILQQYYEGALSKEKFLQHQDECLAFVEQSGCLQYGRAIQNLYIDRAHELFDLLEGVEEWKEKLRVMTIGERSPASEAASALLHPEGTED
ncbi:polyprenyl synthetase family protein [Paenibacillus senegalensis]|uniref:polyprenyl synthetase family protein n=1 Tax=Paenibacillus senegalensis TaxID=1465766 RepID=UPI000288E27B|nr:polyprenyl synthetase family protein [Paenibacillus senegalensis]